MENKKIVNAAELIGVFALSWILSSGIIAFYTATISSGQSVSYGGLATFIGSIVIAILWFYSDLEVSGVVFVSLILGGCVGSFSQFFM